MVSDLGWLWDKYHKESHDQWKVQLNALGENIKQIEQQVETVTGVEITPATEETQKILPQYAQEIQIESGKNKETTQTQVENPAPQIDDAQNGKPSLMIRLIGFLLQQKAIIVFGGFGITVFCLDVLLRGLWALRPRRKDHFSSPKSSKKGEGYKYGRK